MRAFVLVLIIFLAISCSDKASVPNGVLPPDNMQAVLWDVLKADEVNNYRKSKDSSFYQLSNQLPLFDTVFSFHNTSSEQFKKSLKFYQSRPDLFKVVLDSLQRKSDRYNIISVQ